MICQIKKVLMCVNMRYDIIYFVYSFSTGSTWTMTKMEIQRKKSINVALKVIELNRVRVACSTFSLFNDKYRRKFTSSKKKFHYAKVTSYASLYEK